MKATRSLFKNYAQQRGREGGLLFTPGPLSTSKTVKESMMQDYGSRDTHFVGAVKEIREKLLDVGKAPATEWTAVPMQGSGTMGIEAVINTTTKKPTLGQGDAKYLVIVNGSYSKRMAAIVEKMGIPLIKFETPEGQDIDLIAFQTLLMENKDITNVGVVHCETSTGAINPVDGIAALVRRNLPNATIFCDAMSCFGGLEAEVPRFCDVMVSSANKCIQGVPGFSFVLAKKSLLEECRGRSSSFTLDLVSQWENLDKTGQFPYTPPVHALIAFRQALSELEAEGGVAARAQRYRDICHTVTDGMTALGFKLFLDPSKPTFGNIITAFHMPTSANWDFQRFYTELQSAGFVIYPGKASEAPTFRIGSIGDLTVEDAKALVEEVGEVLKRMDVTL